MTNEQLAKAIKQGQDEPITELWERTRGFIYYTLKKLITGNPNNARRMVQAGFTSKDLGQEAFIILFNAVQAFDPAGGYSFVNSLYYATKRRFFELIGLRTAKGRNDPLTNSDRLEREIQYGDSTAPLGDYIADERAEEEFNTTVDNEFHSELKVALNTAVNTLEPLQKQAIEGYFFQGKTLKVLAKERGVSLEAIRSQKEKALRRLRKEDHIKNLRPFIIDEYAYKGGLHSFRNTWTSSTERTAMKLMEAEQKDLRTLKVEIKSTQKKL